jgi:hypothetical protein
MVAGKAITTQAQTKEFDEGFDRIFGNVKPKRGRTVYTSGGEPLPEPIEVGDDWSADAGRAQTVTEELVYSGARTPGDNIDISSRKKHREYLKQNGLAMASDYPASYMEREASRRDREETQKVRAQVDRDVHKIFGG